MFLVFIAQSKPKNTDHSRSNTTVGNGQPAKHSETKKNIVPKAKPKIETNEVKCAPKSDVKAVAKDTKSKCLTMEEINDNEFNTIPA